MPTRQSKMRRISQKISQHRQAKRMASRSSGVGPNVVRDKTMRKITVFRFKVSIVEAK